MGESERDKSQKLIRAVRELGMEALGAFSLEPGEVEPFVEGGGHYIGVMISSPGHAMWPVFSASTEYADAKPDPLNRWSERVLGEVANNFSARLILPFETPYPPFQKWASESSGLLQSVLGMLIDEQYGLWFGLRGILYFELNVENQVLKKLIQKDPVAHDICSECISQPCLSACPVSAFSDGALDVERCFSHIDSTREPVCATQGCAARAACPVGTEHVYSKEQLRFHMAAFRQ